MPADDEETDLTADSDSDESAEIDDLKAKMRQALQAKQAHDRGGDDQGHRKGEKPPGTHGPLGGVHMHRRKAGGGGS